MGTLENHHSKNDVISIIYEEIRFRPWTFSDRQPVPDGDMPEGKTLH
jgi:hypothetical protein